MSAAVRKALENSPPHPDPNDRVATAEAGADLHERVQRLEEALESSQAAGTSLPVLLWRRRSTAFRIRVGYVHDARLLDQLVLLVFFASFDAAAAAAEERGRALAFGAGRTRLTRTDRSRRRRA